ncbi:uncharacterized protein [Diadema antillarum]|uniref:uncharacterized protein n=1 Tax=Diadema antillarum TaxID=105358 RepID=UPI003A875B2B
MSSCKLSISVCTSASSANVQGLIDEMRSRFRDIVADVDYFKLPYNDIDKFSVADSGIDVMLLCHSIHNRRFAITDVTDALYQKFLPKAARVVGKSRVGVIVHDMPKDKFDRPDVYAREMNVFRRQQPKTFKNSALAMIAGKLDFKPVEIIPDDWARLEGFVREASLHSRQQTERGNNKSLDRQCLIVTLALIVTALVLV